MMKQALPLRLPVCILSLALLLHSPHEVLGKIIYVGPEEEYNNIMWGLAQAQDGDTVMVRDGVYVQDIKVRAGVVLMAEHQHMAVIGDSSDIRSMISVRQAEVHGAVIDGFKFAPGDYPGILVGDMDPSNIAEDCVIKNNLIEGRNTGIMTSPYSMNTTIDGNIISGMSGMGISIVGTGDHVISNNTLEDCAMGAIGLGEVTVDYPLGQTLIRGNTISDNQGGGIAISRPMVHIERNLLEGNLIGITSSSAGNSFVIADSNQVVGNVEAGIYIENGCEAIIQGNEISFNGNEGVMNRGNSRIEANFMEGNEFGVVNSNGSVHVEDNDILHSAIHGVEIRPESLGATIHNNRISENTLCGIFSMQKAIITGNTIGENGEHGIMLLQDARDVEIINQNTISGNLGWEIGVEQSASALISNNTIEDDTTRMDERVAHSGIFINGSARIHGNQIRKMNSAAIYIADSAGVVEITGQNFIEYNQYGILSLASATVKDNTISHNRETGILLGEPASDVKIQWNQVKGNNTGIECYTAIPGLDVYWNSINENAIGMIARGEALFRRNTVAWNEQVGIWIEESGIDLGTAGTEDGTDADSGMNSILENGEWNIRNDSEDTILAAYNYWGLNDADSIDASIRDDEEDPLAGPVLFEPVLGDLNVGGHEIMAHEVPGSPEMLVYPNPSHGNVNILFTLKQPGPVCLNLVDLSGRDVQTLVNGAYYPAGTHRITRNLESSEGTGLAGGTYLIILRSGGKVQVIKALLLR